MNANARQARAWCPGFVTQFNLAGYFANGTDTGLVIVSASLVNQ